MSGCVASSSSGGSSSQSKGHRQPPVEPVLAAGQERDAGPGGRLQQARRGQGEPEHGRLRDLPHPAADVSHLRQPAGPAHLVPRLGRGRVRQEGPAARHRRPVDQAGPVRLLRRAQEAVHRLAGQEGVRARQLLLVGDVLQEVQLRQVGRAGAQDVGRVPGAVQDAQVQGRRPDRTRRGRGHRLGRLRVVRLPRHPHQRRAVPPRPARRKAQLRRPPGPQGLRQVGGSRCRTSTPTAPRCPSRTPPPRCSTTAPA